MILRVIIYFSILKFDVILTAIYGYHTDRAYEFIGPHICTQHVSITICVAEQKWKMSFNKTDRLSTDEAEQRESGVRRSNTVNKIFCERRFIKQGKCISKYFDLHSVQILAV